MVTCILCERRYCLFDDSEHKEHQNRLLINNCYQITYFLKINRQIYSAPLSAISSVLFAENPRHPIQTPEILSLLPFLATRTSFSITLSTNICLPFKSLLRGLFDFRIAMQIPLPAIALGISMKSISKHPSRRPVFHPKINPFLCTENTPQKCKWLQCVRLVGARARA